MAVLTLMGRLMPVLQAYQQGQYGTASLGGGNPLGLGAAPGAPAAPAAALVKPELLDPLAAIDIDKLNAAFVQRHLGTLLGSHMHT